MMNAQYNPHPSLNRGKLKLTERRFMDWGIDPAKKRSYDCPFYEGEKDRHAILNSTPQARPRTPPRSQRWRSEAGWADSTNHGHFKITHTMPALPINTERSIISSRWG